MCREYQILSLFCFFFKQKTAYELRISDWSSDVCSSDLDVLALADETEAGHLHHALVAIELLDAGAHFLEHALGTVERGARRQLHDRHRIALVFLVQEAAGHAREQEAAQQRQAREHQHPARDWKSTRLSSSH